MIELYNYTTEGKTCGECHFCTEELTCSYWAGFAHIRKENRACDKFSPKDISSCGLLEEK